MPPTVHLRTGGSGGPTLLLLHGLGATGDVWDGVTALWPGRVIVPDLPGHGASAPLPTYTFATMAAAVAAAIATAVPGARDTALPGARDTALPGTVDTVLGHSLGGVLALELASGRHGTPPRRAVGLGIKIAWTPSELERAAALAARPARTFTARADAVDRHLAVAGLTGLVPPDDPRALAGVRPAGEGWQLALDPATFGVGAPDMPALLADARCPVVLAAGEHDHMVDAAALRALFPEAVIVAGAGHNVHVENPALLSGLIPAWEDSPDGKTTAKEAR